MARLVLTRRALNRISQLPQGLQEAVEGAMDRLQTVPEAGKALLGRLAGTWALRVGNYRVLYTIEGSVANRIVIVRSVRHRAVVYGRRRRRQ